MTTYDEPKDNDVEALEAAAPEAVTSVKEKPTAKEKPVAKEKPAAKEKETPSVTIQDVTNAANAASQTANYDAAIKIAEDYLKQPAATNKHHVQEHLTILKGRAANA